MRQACCGELAALLIAVTLIAVGGVLLALGHVWVVTLIVAGLLILFFLSPVAFF